MNKRAVAYCRVSTDSKDQNNSYESQKKSFDMYFDEVDGIDLVEIYADRGLSGTKLSRPQFDRMLQDAGLQKIVDKETNMSVNSYKIVAPSKFDYIYVTNISRFARNISADSFIKTLAINHVYLVYVDAQDIVYSTETEAGEKVIIDELVHAERFSRDLSAKVKKGMKQGARNGNIYTSATIYGYDYHRRNLDDPSKGNYFTINEEEAKIVRRIFDLYCNEHMGSERIANELAKEGMFTHGNKKFASNTILGIIKNEKYCGINNAMHYDKGAIFGDRKLRTVNYDDKVRVRARKATEELKEQGFEKIPPIISIEQWEEAQRIRTGRKSSENNRGKYHGKTDFAGLLVCGKCGCTYQAAGVKKNKDGTIKERYYACRHRYRFDEEHGVPECLNPVIPESRLNEVLSVNGYCLRRMFRIADLIKAGKLYKEKLLANVNQSFVEQIAQLQVEVAEVRQQKDRLLDLFVKGKCSESQYDERIKPLNEQEEKMQSDIDRMSMSNDEIYKAVAEIDYLLKTAEEERAKLNDDMNAGKWKESYTRKDLLFDVDKIVVDEQGEVRLMFKTLQQMETLIHTLIKVK